MTNSIFTQIINREMPGHVIYEDDQTIAILDITPLSTGHTLVVPKHEVAKIGGLTDEEASALFLTVKRITGILDEALKPAGFTIGLNQTVGQGVPHVHMHIIPRYQNDGGTSLHSVVSNPPSEALEETLKRIRKSL